MTITIVAIADSVKGFLCYTKSQKNAPLITRVTILEGCID